MRARSLSILSLGLWLFVVPAQASYFVVPVSGAMDPSRRTHFVVAGNGNNLGTSPQLAAGAKAKRLAQLTGGDQVVFISSGKNLTSLFDELGFTNERFVPDLLDVNALMQELKPYRRIASIHVFGHAAITEGVFLDTYPGGRDVRWYADDPATQTLKGHFTGDAFVALNGCNSGHVMAYNLSKTWAIPVSGSLGGTHFEGIFEDGRAYSADGKYSRSWRPLASEFYRMRPDDSAYCCHYGRYTTGLPFYKFFCAENVGAENCLAAMARSIYVGMVVPQLSMQPNFSQYAQAVREWMCPAGHYLSSSQQECMDRLAQLDVRDFSRTDRSYTPFRGESMQCNFQTCYQNNVCGSTPSEASACARSSAAGNSSTTFVEEYIYYLRAYTVSTGALPK